MVVTKYDFPCPNSHGRYDLSMDELVELLDQAYENGLKQGKLCADTSYTASATYENMDDNSRWKENMN